MTYSLSRTAPQSHTAEATSARTCSKSFEILNIVHGPEHLHRTQDSHSCSCDTTICYMHGISVLKQTQGFTAGMDGWYL